MEDRCRNPRCRRILIDAAGRGVHPTPDCDPTTEWWMSQAELDELAARYWPTPNPAAQEAIPE